MIINIVRDKGTVKVNSDFASAVSEFADLLNDNSLGAVMMAYVVFVNDPAEDNIWANLPEEVRGAEVAESLKIDKSLLKNTKVVAAMKKYKSFVDQNIGYQFKNSYINGMRKISKYVDSKKSLDETDAKEFAAVMKEMPNLLKGKGDLEKMGTKEQGKVTIRGHKQPTENEKANR